MAAAIGELEAVHDMEGIAGDCGFLINYQATTYCLLLPTTYYQGK